MTVTPIHRRSGSASARWRPSRAGIVNVWRYYGETFEFHRGRMLLRGPNGTGKSKALELLLPYLLDANLRPSRLSTFGSAERSMHWNLMGEGSSGTTRVGYVWLEFARSGATEPEWFTCGARLQASAHTTAVGADYFTTTRRIGTPDGLSLLGSDGRPLSRAALAEALSPEGALYGSAGDYRGTVRRTLYGALNEQRYDSLIAALLQLRVPKLSERLDPAVLSTMLSRALPSIGQAEIAELAEGFERLDRQRESMRLLDQEVEAAQELAGRQRGYARRVLRSVAAELIGASTELDRLTRAARDSRRRHDRAVAEQAKLTAQATALDAECGELRARIDGLTGSEAYRRGGELDRLRQQATAAARLAEQAAAQAGRQQADAATDAEAAGAAEQARAEQAAAAAAAAEEATRAAEHAGMAASHAEVHAAATRSGRSDSPSQQLSQQLAQQQALQLPRQLLRAAVDSRLQQLAEVRRAHDAHAAAVRDRQRTERDLEVGRDELAAASAARDAARAEHRGRQEELAERLREWASGCAELPIAGPDRLAALAALAGSEPAVAELVDTAAAEVLDRLATARAEAAARRGELDAERAELDAERAALREHAELPPPAPATRTAQRRGRPGAPLWRLVAFRDGTDPATQAGVEAALEACGLLDAWVLPAAGVETAGAETAGAETAGVETAGAETAGAAEGGVAGLDTFAEPDLLGPAPGGSLADVLDVEADTAGVPAERVRRLLAAIGYGPSPPAGHPAAVGADGGWRLAGLHGRWTKADAAHIGAAARERARRHRISQLGERIAAAEAAIAEQDAELGRLAARRDAVAAERAARPRHDGVRAAREALDRAESAVAVRDDAVRRWLATAQETAQEAAATLAALSAIAAEHRLPTDAAALDGVHAAVDAVRRLGDAWLDRHQQLLAAERAARVARTVARRSAELAEELAAVAAERDADARRQAAAVDAAQRSVGADYRKILDEITDLRATLDRRSSQARALAAKGLELATSIGSLDRQRSVDAAASEGAVAARDAAADRFRHLVSTTLPADARLDLSPLPPTTGGDGDEPGTAAGDRAVLDAARRIAATLRTVPYQPKNIRDAEARLAEVVHTCRHLLADRAELAIELDDDVQLLTATVGGVRVGAAELIDGLRADRDRAQGDLTAAEQDLFDRTLTGDTRRHLATRMRQATELVDAMNARLQRVRTASRVAVRLVWQVDPKLPPGTRKARELLLKDQVELSEKDREALHKFFRERIDEARASDSADGWEQQLLRVFDYTNWHRFDVRIDRANGTGWQLLTKRLHGALSGGEKAIVLHLPLFAAVAAHYQSEPAAPRLIILDEVFVGVDATNRGQVFELLASLDLDLLLTSDHEWCTYRELDGIAIHQLITGGDGDDAVTTARFVWDGRRLQADEDTGPTDLPDATGPHSDAPWVG